MQVAAGKSVLGGIAIGRIRFVRKADSNISDAAAASSKTEMKRFLNAQQQAVKQQQELYQKAQTEANADIAEVFEIHAMMLEDDDYVDAIKKLIVEHQKSAEYAVKKASDDQAAVFASMDNAYMQARSADVQDIGQAMLNILQGEDT